MSHQLRSLLNSWLNWLAFGVVLSTCFCTGLLVYDVNGFASTTLATEGGAVIRGTLWAMLSVLFGPVAAAIDAMLSDSKSD